MDAFDANVLIYVAQQDPRGDRAFESLRREPGVNIGSVLLTVEVLGKPIRTGDELERSRLVDLLGLLELKPADEKVAEIATELSAKYRLRPLDAAHLATAVLWGASRFHTNNSKDFAQHIDEIDIVLP